MFRKTICIAVVLLMMAVIFPSGAFAETEISRIDVLGVSLPVAGDKPDYTVTLPNDAGCTLGAFGWYKRIGDNGFEEVGSDTAFEAGEEYFIYMTFDLKAGYAFAENVTVNFLDDAGAVLPGLNDSVLWYDGTTYYVYSAYMGSTDPEEIESVSITGFTHPMDGQSVSELPAVALATPNCSIVSTKWYKAGREFAGNFAAGSTYTFKIELLADYGYTFRNPVNVSMGGEQVQTVNTGKTLTVSLDVPISVIRFVDLVTAYVPQAGAHPEMHKGLTVASGAPYVIGEQGWLDENYQPFEVFELGGHYYKQAMSITPASGYAFASDLVVKLDGAPVDYTALSGGGISVITFYVTCLYQFSPMLGDADENGYIDTTDALLILRHSLGIELRPECVWPYCDVSCDGTIDTEDALHALRMALGLEATQPYSPEPTPEPQAPVVFTVESKYGVQSGSVIDVTFSIRGEYEANALSCSINFDPSKLQIMSVTEGEVLTAHEDALVYLDHETAPGSILLGVLMPDGPMTEEGVLITMRFKVKSGFNAATNVTANVNEFVSCPDLTSIPIEFSVVNGVLSPNSN